MSEIRWRVSSTVCRIVGHRRESYIGRVRYDWRGRRRETYYSRCTRCGCQDGSEVYREGLLERFAFWHIRRAIYQARKRLKAWRHTECEDCRKPCLRFGKEVGDHRDCDVIPF